MRFFIKQLIIFLLNFAIVSNTFAQNNCEDLFSSETTADAKLKQDIKTAGAELAAQLTHFTSEQHDEALKKAEELIDLQKTGKVPNWLSTANKHRSLIGIWAAYFASSIYISEFKIHDLRAAGYVNYLTLHFSNFFVGLGMTGLFHQFVCESMASCKAAYNYTITENFQSRLRKSLATAIEAKEFIKNFSSGIGNYRLKTFLVTATIFTIANSAAELNGYFRERGNIDWHDFITGEACLIIYYYLSKVLDKKLALSPIP